MATYKIRGVYEYEATIEANNPEEAQKKFLSDLNSHYTSTEDYDCDEICADCETDPDYCECAEVQDDDEE